jgi:predicted metal-dependent hydrolase
MSSEDTKEICDRLDVLIKLSAANVIIDKQYDDQVRILSSAGFQPKEIAGFLDKTPNAISIKLFELRKKKSVPKKAIQETF